MVGFDVYMKFFLNKLLLDDFKYTKNEVAITNTLLFSGVVLGGLLTGRLANKYGRRNLLLLSIFMIIIIIVIIILFTSQIMTYFNRLLYGFFSIQIFSTFIMVAEIFP
jgi:MFS family permease